ncbi:hypothetical protein [Bacillus thuringiensis]|uniref:hypothetical protein n=1 Tax=Bacillus thuringiensis TaxID=1428 RepID=UPI0011A70ED6|nr:hypothetical protein [Bacillus thuringiensis]
MQPLAQKGYSAQQVMDVLHAKSKARNIRFRYDLLDKNLNFKRTLDNILDGEVTFSSFSAIKRTAKFTLREKYTPAHIERQARTVNYYTGNSSNVYNLRFESWTKTNVAMDVGEMRLQPYSGVIANSTLESNWYSLWSGDGATGWMTGDVKPWNSGTVYSANKGGGWQGEWAQEIIRSASGTYPTGFQTINNTLVNASGGQKLYASFFYRVFNGEVHPNYVYAMSSAGNVRFNENITMTATGYNGWYRWEGECTIPSGRANASYGLLTACDSGALNGICNYDNIYFSGTAKAIYSGIATSPVLDMSNSTYQGVDIPRVKSTEVTFEKVNGTPTREGSWMPENIVKTRYSLDGGATWSAWVVTNEYNSLGIPAGSDARKLRVQLQWSAGRHNSADNVRLKYVNVAITYEEDTLTPKRDVINYLQDRIKPYMEVEMPDGNWLEFPLGVFLLNSPTRSDQVKGVYRDIEAYDQLVILQEDKTLWNRTFWGYPHEEVADLLESLGFNRKFISIPPTTKSSVWNFSMGTPIIDIINKMLDTAGYTPLWVDANGVFRSQPYVLPTDRPVEYTYQDDELSVTYNGMNEELDLFNTANYVIVVQSNVEKAPLWKARANNDPLSPLSTVSTGRRIVDYREVDNLETQEDVDTYAQRILQETTMAYQKIQFNTALMPFHEYQDCIRVRYSELDIDDRYIETSWKMQLKVGGEMEHEARKVVFV